MVVLSYLGLINLLFHGSTCLVSLFSRMLHDQTLIQELWLSDHLSANVNMRTTNTKKGTLTKQFHQCKNNRHRFLWLKGVLRNLFWRMLCCVLLKPVVYQEKKQRLHSLLYAPYVQIYQQNSELKGCRTTSVWNRQRK